MKSGSITKRRIKPSRLVYERGREEGGGERREGQREKTKGIVCVR